MNKGSEKEKGITRTRAREEVLKFLYRIEMTGETLNSLTKEVEDALGEKLENQKDYVFTLLKGIYKKKDELDEILKPVLLKWRPERINVVEKCILRIALFEMLYLDEIPHPVSVDSAVELAKKFSSDKAGRFVNGVLDALKNKIEKKENDRI